jgi:hypothetical protein
LNTQPQHTWRACRSAYREASRADRFGAAAGVRLQQRRTGREAVQRLWWNNRLQARAHKHVRPPALSAWAPAPGWWKTPGLSARYPRRSAWPPAPCAALDPQWQCSFVLQQWQSHPVTAIAHQKLQVGHRPVDIEVADSTRATMLLDSPKREESSPQRVISQATKIRCTDMDYVAVALPGVVRLRC